MKSIRHLLKIFSKKSIKAKKIYSNSNDIDENHPLNKHLKEWDAKDILTNRTAFSELSISDLINLNGNIKHAKLSDANEKQSEIIRSLQKKINEELELRIELLINQSVFIDNFDKIRNWEPE